MNDKKMNCPFCGKKISNYELFRSWASFSHEDVYFHLCHHCKNRVLLWEDCEWKMYI